MPSVIVNLNVNVDATGTVEVFGQEPQSFSNVVVCEHTLPAADLYASDEDAVFEFWEPESAIGTKLAARKSAWTKSAALRNDLNAIINDYMDASGAAPFSTYAAGGVEQYYRHVDFGRLALSNYAHYLFGHAAATAAITNDQAFMDKMNGDAVGDALLAKGLRDLIENMADADVLEVVKQVIGQDAERAKDQDNNELTPDVKQSLKFLAGDVVYVQITLQQPTVTVSNGAAVAQQSEPLASAVTQQTYNLKITLA